MKFLKHPVALISLAVLVGGAVFGRIDIALLGLLGFIASAAWLGMRAAQRRAAEAKIDEVSNANRVLIAPLRRLHGEIENILERAQNNPTVKVIGAEAVAESTRILQNAARILSLRDQVKTAQVGKVEAASQLSELTQRLSQAQTESERQSLEVAAEARRQEIRHYAETDKVMQRIDSILQQSESALSELKARLTVAMASNAGVEASDEEMAQTFARIKGLTASFDEAEQLAREVQA